MWVFTPLGFFSIVQDHDNLGMLCIRGRVKKDMENFAEQAGRFHRKPIPILSTPNSDYPYRIVMPRSLVSCVMERFIGTLDYSNFKDEVERQQGRARHDMYLDVWGKMLNLEGKLKVRQAQLDRAPGYGRKSKKATKSEREIWDESGRAIAGLDEIMGAKPPNK